SPLAFPGSAWEREENLHPRRPLDAEGQHKLTAKEQTGGGSMRRLHTFLLTPLLATTLSFLVLTWPTFAQDKPCAADVQKLCGNVDPDNKSGVLQCLKEHETELSDACKERLQTFAHEPCAEDAEKFCQSVELRNRLGMVHCLKGHETE